jgi:hypothetical protein
LSGAVIVFSVLLATVVWMLLDPRDSRRLMPFCLGLAVAAYSPICGAVLRFENSFAPLKFDGVLYRIDSDIGVSAFAVAAGLHNGWTGALLRDVYMCLLPMMVLWAALQVHRGWPGPSILWTYAIELTIGPLLYLPVPACGPRCAFPGFPITLPTNFANILPISGGDPNAMPSIHISTAFVLFLFARGKFWRTFAGIFLATTVLATLITGEHYVIDGIVGAAFGCFVVSAAHRRLAPAVLFISTVLAWILLIRTKFEFLLLHPDSLRIATVGTVGLCVAYAIKHMRRAYSGALTEGSLPVESAEALRMAAVR